MYSLYKLSALPLVGLEQNGHSFSITCEDVMRKSPLLEFIEFGLRCGRWAVTYDVIDWGVRFNVLLCLDTNTFVRFWIEVGCLLIALLFR